MQYAYPAEVEKKPAPPSAEQERPVRKARRTRLLELLAEFGGAKALAEKVGSVETHLIACAKGRRGIGDELASKLEAGCGKSFGWMDEDGRGWPFEQVSPETYRDRLSERQKGAVEGYVMRLLGEAPSLGGSPESDGSGHPEIDAA